ncbi:unnamed protein product [Adineta steineri]|uniref:Uncharacterized protein n=1 Tax=Adineta steineri TaxID=433720 RepID=A0A814ICF4_9BILA|nr:unnamed protein product [Adineta steineri]CAF3687107.1 unnamed protein product [Adineta steineri]
MHPQTSLAPKFKYQPIINLNQTNAVLRNQNYIPQMQYGLPPSIPKYQYNKEKQMTSFLKNNNKIKNSPKPPRPEVLSNHHSLQSIRSKTNDKERSLTRPLSFINIPSERSVPVQIPSSYSAGHINDRIQKERKAHTMPPLPRIVGPSTSPKAKLFASIVAPVDAQAIKISDLMRKVSKTTTTISSQRSEVDITDDDSTVIVKVRYDPSNGAPPSEEAVREAINNQLVQRSHTHGKKEPIVVNFSRQNIQSQFPIRQLQAPINRPIFSFQQRPPVQIPAHLQQQLQPQSQPRPQAQPPPQTQSRPQSQPRPQAQPQAQIHPQYQPQPQAQAQTHPQYQPQPQPQPQAQPQAQPQPQPQPQAQPQSRPQSQQQQSIYQPNPLPSPKPSQTPPSFPSAPPVRGPSLFNLQNGNIYMGKPSTPLFKQQYSQPREAFRLPNQNSRPLQPNTFYPTGINALKATGIRMATEQTPSTVSDQPTIPNRLQAGSASSEMFRPAPISDVPELSKESLLNMLNQIPDLQGRHFNIEYAPPSAPEGYPIPMNIPSAGAAYPEPVVIDKLPNNVIQHIKLSNNPALTAALEATIRREQSDQFSDRTQSTVSSLNVPTQTIMHHAAQPHDQVQQSRPASSNDSESSTEVSSSGTTTSSSSGSSGSSGSSSSSSSSTEESETEETKHVPSARPMNNVPFVGPASTTSYSHQHYR